MTLFLPLPKRYFGNYVNRWENTVGTFGVSIGRAKERLIIKYKTNKLLFSRTNIIQINSQVPEPFRGPRARFARSGENGEGEVRSL